MISLCFSGLADIPVYRSGLLAYRIWLVHKRSNEYLSSERKGLSMILRVVIESGAIYSVTIIIALVCFLVNSPGVYVVLNLVRLTPPAGSDSH